MVLKITHLGQATFHGLMPRQSDANQNCKYATSETQWCSNFFVKT